jgi:hypothetical protein
MQSGQSSLHGWKTLEAKSQLGFDECNHDLATYRSGLRQRNKSELEWAAEYCRRRARAAWNSRRQDRSEQWIRLKAPVADALLKASRL